MPKLYLLRQNPLIANAALQTHLNTEILFLKKMHTLSCSTLKEKQIRCVHYYRPELKTWEGFTLSFECSYTQHKEFLSLRLWYTHSSMKVRLCGFKCDFSLMKFCSWSLVSCVTLPTLAYDI